MAGRTEAASVTVLQHTCGGRNPQQEGKLSSALDPPMVALTSPFARERRAGTLAEQRRRTPQAPGEWQRAGEKRRETPLRFSPHLDDHVDSAGLPDHLSALRSVGYAHVEVPDAARVAFEDEVVAVLEAGQLPENLEHTGIKTRGCGSNSECALPRGQGQAVDQRNAERAGVARRGVRKSGCGAGRHL